MPGTTEIEKPKRRYSLGKRDATMAATRERIVAAARELVASRGYHRTSMQDVAARAGVARATVFLHFPSKEALLQAVMGQAGPGGEGIQVAWSLPDPGEATRQLLHAVVRFWSSDPALFRRGASATYAGGASLAVPEVEAQRAILLQELVNRLEQHGCLRSGWSPQRAADLLWTLSSFSTFDQLYAERHLDPDSIGDLLVAVCDSTFLAPSNAGKQAPAQQIARPTEQQNGRIVVREMRPDELIRVDDIDVSESGSIVYEYARGYLAARSEEWERPRRSAELWNRYIEDWSRIIGQGGTAFGAFDGERLAGIAVLRYKLESDMSQLAALFVSKDDRRSGVASRLVEAAIERAREKGARRLYVSATPSESAVGFYRRQGFRPTSEVNRELFELEPEDIHMVMEI